MQFHNTADVASNGVKSLVYGPSGAGKTRLTLTCPQPVVLSAEGGLLSLRGAAIPFKPITTVSELEQMYNYFAYAQDQYHFKTIVIDSISEIAETVLKRAKAAAGKDPRRAYGSLIDEMIPIVKMFRDLPYRHVIVTAKEERSKDEATGYMMYQPSLPGSKLGPELPYLFDEVFRYVKGIDPATRTPYSYLQTFSDHQTVAKDRSGALAPYEAPDMGAIYGKIGA